MWFTNRGAEDLPPPFDQLMVVRSFEPHAEPMGLCFSAPKVLIRQVHFPKAASVSDVSFASVLAPCALLSTVWFRRGEEAEGPRHRDEEIGGRPWPLEKTAEGHEGGASGHLFFDLDRKAFSERPHFLTKSLE